MLKNVCLCFHWILVRAVKCCHVLFMWYMENNLIGCYADMSLDSPQMHTAVASYWKLCTCQSFISLMITAYSLLHLTARSDHNTPSAMLSRIARFMGPTWGQSGADRTQVGPMLAPWTLLCRVCPVCYHWRTGTDSISQFGNIPRFISQEHLLSTMEFPILLR